MIKLYTEAHGQAVANAVMTGTRLTRDAECMCGQGCNSRLCVCWCHGDEIGFDDCVVMILDDGRLSITGHLFDLNATDRLTVMLAESLFRRMRKGKIEYLYRCNHCTYEFWSDMILSKYERHGVRSCEGKLIYIATRRGV